MNYDAIIIGGGAAGLFCAITAGGRGRRVMVVEHNAEVGRKILISGGGRCNFTNLQTSPENFVSQNPHFCKSALAGYTPLDFVAFIHKHKIDYYEKKLGQLFCRESSRAVVKMLLDECKRARVEIKTNCSVQRVQRLQTENTDESRFTVSTNLGEFSSKSLVIACGGLSFPKIGASDFGYWVARDFGLKIIETRPSLVALVKEGSGSSELAGIAIDAIVSSGKQSFRENILFTHRGLSGPAILQASNYWKKDEPIFINVLPDVDASSLLKTASKSEQQLENFFAKHLPRRFVEVFLKQTLRKKRVRELNEQEIEEVRQRLNNWHVKFVRTEGYDRAEVTAGGVSTDELSSKTMEAKKVAGLYFIGEVVDVTGWLGGYNFQWAWASAFAAGKAL